MDHRAGHLGRRLEHKSTPCQSRVRQHQRKAWSEPARRRAASRDRSAAVPSVPRAAGRVGLRSAADERANRAARARFPVSTAPLRKLPWSGGPPTGAVSCHVLRAMILIRGCAASRATAASKFSCRFPWFEPRLTRQTDMAFVRVFTTPEPINSSVPPLRRSSAGHDQITALLVPRHTVGAMRFSRSNTKALGGAVRAATRVPPTVRSLRLRSPKPSLALFSGNRKNLSSLCGQQSERISAFFG